VLKDNLPVSIPHNTMPATGPGGYISTANVVRLRRSVHWTGHGEWCCC